MWHLHGPHHSAQKSATRMREDERREEKCVGDVISTDLDMMGDRYVCMLVVVELSIEEGRS